MRRLLSLARIYVPVGAAQGLFLVGGAKMFYVMHHILNCIFRLGCIIMYIATTVIHDCAVSESQITHLKAYAIVWHFRSMGHNFGGAIAPSPPCSAAPAWYLLLEGGVYSRKYGMHFPLKSRKRNQAAYGNTYCEVLGGRLPRLSASLRLSHSVSHFL